MTSPRRIHGTISTARSIHCQTHPFSGDAGPDALTVMAQVTVADVVTILSVPIVLQPDRALHAVLGSTLVAAAVLMLLGSARLLADRAWVHRAPRLSRQRHFST